MSEFTPGPWTISDLHESDVEGAGELLASAYPMKHDGLHDSWKANATLICAAPDMLAALSLIDCPLCDHPLGLHADKYGCEREMGDREGCEGEPAEARGPCSCNGGTLEDVQRVIAAIRKAKGHRIFGRQKEEGIA